jgi:predicted DNA-binding transcriptional regulator AlpA
MSRSVIPGTAIPCPGNPSCGLERDSSGDLPPADFRGAMAETAQRPKVHVRNGFSHGHQATNEDPDTQRYVSRRELRRLFPVSDMTIFRWTRDSRVAFPRPVKLGPSGRNFWWLPAILKWDSDRQRRNVATGIGPSLDAATTQVEEGA